MTLAHELVEYWAEKTPEAVAVIFDNEQWTYRELDTHANTLACELIKSINFGSLIGVGLEPSYEMIVSMLAILKAGAAYVPLDPAYPKARLSYMIEQTNLSLVLTNKSLKERWPCPTYLVQAKTLAAPELKKPIKKNNDLAYIIFTSGSTGQPKGVMGHHRGLDNLVKVFKDALGLTPADRVLQCASLSFDAATWEIFMALGTGAALVISDRDTRRSSEALAELIKQQKISVVTLMPTMLSELKLKESSSSLRLVISAGESCSKEIAQKWAQKCKFVNAYGPTETTVCATLAFYDPKRQDDPPIGHPIANMRAYVLDENMKPVPDQSPGELYIAGIGVAFGYLNNPELSSQKFLPDLIDKNQLMYRTGDRAYYDKNQELRFLGRLDDQIKLRGHRIEIPEIEHALLKHEQVKSAAVVLKDGQLAAFIASEFSIPPAVFREHLSSLLPDYMIPHTFSIMKSLPLNAHQKIDRQILKTDSFSFKLSSAYEEPRDSKEQELTKIWCKAFKLKKIGIHDNFFELGGHSLLMSQIIAEARIHFDIDFPLDTIFKAQTIASLAKLATNKVEHCSNILRRDLKAPVPLTSGQHQLWFAQQMIGDLPAFNIPIALKIRGPLDIAQIQYALDSLIERHESLRTTFHSVKGLPEQIIGPARSCEIAYITKQEIPLEIARSFDLKKDLMLRASLIQNSAHEHILLVCVHHIIFDGWSYDILISDLTHFLSQKSSLPKLDKSYADYAYARKLLEPKVSEQHEQFWLDLLKDFKIYQEIATDFPRPPMRSYRGSGRKIDVSPEIFAKIRHLSARENISPYVILLAALYILLMRETSHKKLLVGGIAANRQDFSTQNIIGLFANMMALPMDMANKNFPELLKAVRDLVVRAQMHQEMPFDAVVRKLGCYDPQRSPLFQIMFRYEVAKIPDESLDISMLELDSHTSKLDLELIAVQKASSLSLQMQFDDHLFKPERIDTLLYDFVAILKEYIGEGQEQI